MNDDELLAAVRGSLGAARDSMAAVHMKPPVEELMARGHGRRMRRAMAIRAAVACTAAAVSATVVIAVTGGSGADQARAIAYVTSHVEHALASEDLVFAGRSEGNAWGLTRTWDYGARHRFLEFWPAADYRDRIVDGRRLWDFPPRFRGQPALAQGTALVGGKLRAASVTYYDRTYSLYGPPVPPPASACSTNVELAMGGPLMPSPHWSAFLNATLACGAAAVTGHVRIDGIETTKITGRPVTVKLAPAYGRGIGAKFAKVTWTMYVNSATFLPVRVYGATQTFGGPAAPWLSSSVTDVRWLPPTPANIAKALVTIPRGFRQVG